MAVSFAAGFIVCFMFLHRQVSYYQKRYWKLYTEVTLDKFNSKLKNKGAMCEKR